MSCTLCGNFMIDSDEGTSHCATIWDDVEFVLENDGPIYCDADESAYTYSQEQIADQLKGVTL